MQLKAFTLLLISSLCSAQVLLIMEDDNTSDPDGMFTDFTSMFKLADQGGATVLGMNADSANVLAAPGMRQSAVYYLRPNLLIGANQTSNPGCSNGCNTSTWLSSLIGQYAPGDTRANYPSCITTDRTILAAASSISVTIIENGVGTCLYGLLTSTADGISPLTGAQLCQQKVAKLVMAAGFYPSGASYGTAEYNFASNSSQWSAIFSTWTTQNGYPPIWLSGADNATGTDAGPPSYALANTNPARYAALAYGQNQRPVWGGLSVLYAVRGLAYGGITYFTDSGDGTNTVNATTGVNTWNSGTSSGHHYLTAVPGTTALSHIFDGFAYGFGFAALPPGANLGTYISGPIRISGPITAK